MSDKIKLLIVDDDETIVESLSKSLTFSFPDFEISATIDGQSALELCNNAPPDLILSDINMPLMDGLSMTKSLRANEKTKDVYIILFTGFRDDELLLKVFENGSDDYLTKPFKQDELNARIKAAVRIINLQKSLKEDNEKLKSLADALAKDIEDMKRISCKFVQARVPALYSMFDKIASASIWIAGAYGDISEEQIKNIEMTAYLSYVGKLFLPDDLIKKAVMIDGHITHELMYQVPHVGNDILKSVVKLHNASDLIFALYENFDGTGIPNQLKSWQIPIGSRIIRVVLDFYESIFILDKDVTEAFIMINKNSNRLYDNKLVTLLDQYIQIAEKDSDIYQNTALKIFELKEEMVLACDVITQTGFKLMSEGTVLTQTLIKKLITHSTTDRILGDIIIKKNKS